MNETVAAYCHAQGIPCTRSRPYHKNDQAWVEQKNGSVVRRLVGYRRLEGLAAAAALSRLYAASRLFVNFFQPSFKLASKTRLGAKVRKTYHAPETPYATTPRLRGCHRRNEGSVESGGRPTRPVTAAGGDPIGATPRGGTGRRSDHPPGALGGEPRSLSHRIWPRRGNTARSAPRIASRPGPRVIGAPARIRSSAPGPACARGSRPSPTASARTLRAPPE